MADELAPAVSAWFVPVPVPAIVAAVGSAFAVSLAPATADDRNAEPCRIIAPPALRSAVPARVRAHLGGRHCAVRSLAALGTGAADAPAVGALGAPIWPTGITGSITHASTIAIAVTQRASRLRSIGIDCEPVMSADTADEIAPRVLPEADRVVRRDDGSMRLPWPTFVTVVFSAKESIYKCLSPLTGQFFEFDAVALDWIDVAAGAVGFRVIQDLGETAPVGTLLMARFCVEWETVVTVVTMPTHAGRPHPSGTPISVPA